MFDLMPRSVVIPAAGLGRRMRSFGPKALLEIGGETIIGRQLRLLRSVLPEAKLIVVAGYMGERLARTLPTGVTLVVNEDFENTNVAFSIAMGLEKARMGPALVVYGDLVFDEASLLSASRLKSSFSSVLVDSKDKFSDGEVGVNTVDGKAGFFAYSLETKWAQIMCLNNQDKKTFIRLSSRYRFGYEVLNLMLEREIEFEAVQSEGLVYEVDTSKDFVRANKKFAVAC